MTTPVSARYLRRFVPPPPRTPMPYGLLEAVDLRTDADPHWQAGVEWQPLCGGSSTTFDFCVTGGAPPRLADTGGRDMRAALPFTVYAEIDCSPVGPTWDNEMNDARRLLELTEQYQVERAFWTGQITGLTGLENRVMPHLAANTAVTEQIGGSPSNLITLQTAATVVSGSAVAATAGIGALEAALAACYDGEAILHVPVQAIPVMASNVLFYRDGPALRTFNGNRVVAGAGYANTSPSGVPAAPGTAWIYATGALFAYKSDVKQFTREQSLDRSVNTLKAIAQRNYVLGWDCCHFAVLINV